MKNRKNIARIFWLMSFVCMAKLAMASIDSIHIKGVLQKNTKYAIVVLEKFGVGSYPIYKTEVEQNTNAFEMSLPKTIQPGIYRLRYSQTDNTANVDIIITGKDDIEVYIDLLHSNKSPVFINSEENTAWYNYMDTVSFLETKVGILGDFIQEYLSPEDIIVATARQKRKEIIADLQLLRLKYIADNKRNISGRVEANKPLRFPDVDQPYPLQRYYWWANYWNGIDCADTTLLTTPLYTEHIIRYMQYWVDGRMNFGQEEMGEGFMKSIDSVMQHFSRNKETGMFAAEYLTLGFKELGREDIVEYIDKSYRRPEQCEQDAELRERLEAYKRLESGKPAPKIYYTNSKGVEQEYFWNNKDADKIIVAFWASWCPHCIEAMPMLDSILQNKQSVKAIAISLDTDALAYNSAKAKIKNMFQICDYLGWDTRAAKDYHIVATPTFFLLDRDRFIIGKYPSIQQLLNNL